MFRVYRSTFPTTAAVVAVLILPGLVLLSIGLLQLEELFSLFADPSGLATVTDSQLETTFTDPVFVGAAALGIVLLVIGQLAATPALMQVGATHLAGGRPTVGAALGIGLRRLWGIGAVWVALFLSITAFLLIPLPLLLVSEGFAFLFVATIPVAIASYLVAVLVGYLVAATVVVEDIGAWRALSRTRTLLRTSFWPTFGRGLLVGLLVTIVGQVLGVAGQFAVFAGPELFLAVTVLVNILSYLVSTPLGIYGGLALYGDLRVRTEGTDVLAAAGQLAR